MYNLLISITETRPEHCDIKLIQSELITTEPTEQEKKTGDFVAQALVYVLDKIKLHGELTEELQKILGPKFLKACDSVEELNQSVKDN